MGLPTELGDEKNCLPVFEKPKELVLDPRPKAIKELMLVLPCVDEVQQIQMYIFIINFLFFGNVSNPVLCR